MADRTGIRRRVKCGHRDCTTTVGWMVWKPTKKYANGFEFVKSDAYGGELALRQMCRKHKAETPG